MKRVLIVDVETTGLSPETDHIIEIGFVLWNVRHRAIERAHSSILRAPGNAAEAVNGIPSELVSGLEYAGSTAWAAFDEYAGWADAFCAHQASFDRAFIDLRYPIRLPWICTAEDVSWPRASESKSLLALALAHGVGVVDAHRALSDCLTLARLFSAVADIDERLTVALERALTPKFEYVALVSYDDRQRAKDSGFKWNSDRKVWAKTITEREASELSFPVRRVEQ